LFTHKETGDKTTDGLHELKRRRKRESGRNMEHGTWNQKAIRNE